jgi:1,4-alpha-glucan branching enzyme
MEHPFYGSWGYQTLGYFAPTARYGTPEDFMYLVNKLHEAGFGVILDWVPSHFPSDTHGLAQFDGTYLYEHMDPRLGYHPDWKSSIFNYGRNEVRSFLTSSANFWIDTYHADGLRVDAVASMLYLDYSRRPGEWIPNKYGGRENLDAIEFLKQMNRILHEHHEGILTIAEESTAWPMVTRPVEVGGLGFDLKWNMGWMHDILGYMSRDPLYRKYHHDTLTFSIWYAFSENFVLPLSHDEVVHGKGSLLGKMPGDDWRKFANLRLLLGYMYGHPGKKLLFMGGEFGQWTEWNHDSSLDWHLTEDNQHRQLQRWVEDLNKTYREEPSLHAQDTRSDGFSWVDFRDWENSVISLLRKSGRADEEILAVFNFTPVPRNNYRIGVPEKGFWKELLNSDAKNYGGSGQGNFGGVQTAPVPYHGFEQSISLVLPPLSASFFKNTKN